MIWNPATLKVLQACINEGQSYKEIAPKFGTTVNAVEGAVRRHNLSGMKKVAGSKIIVPSMPERIDLTGCEEENFEELKEKCKLQWSVPKTKVPVNKKKGFKTYVVVADVHIPESNEEAVNCVLQVMDDIKFDGILNLGDFLDLACVSHWNKNRRKTVEGKRLKADFIEGNMLLDEFDKRLPKGADKRFYIGNHCSWLDDLIEDNPALEGIFDADSGLNLTKRGYKIFPYNAIDRIGRLCICHGMYANANTVKKHLDELKVNILIGHGHQIEQRMASSMAREISLAGYEVGCLTNLDPDYAKHRANCHTHGFAIVHFYANGFFDVNLIRIIKGKCIVWGREYNGNIK